MINDRLTLHYVSDDCSGDAFLKVTNDSFWELKASLADYMVVRDGDSYQMIGSGYLKNTIGMQSTSYEGACTVSDPMIGDVFRVVIDIDSPLPFAPVIEGPISIEGADPVSYEDLEEVY